MDIEKLIAQVRVMLTTIWQLASYLLGERAALYIRTPKGWYVLTLQGKGGVLRETEEPKGISAEYLTDLHRFQALVEAFKNGQRLQSTHQEEEANAIKARRASEGSGKRGRPQGSKNKPKPKIKDINYVNGVFEAIAQDPKRSQIRLIELARACEVTPDTIYLMAGLPTARFEVDTKKEWAYWIGGAE